MKEILNTIAERLAWDEGLSRENVLRVLLPVVDDPDLAAAIEREAEVGVPVTVDQVNDAMVRKVAARLAREEDVDPELLEYVLRRLDGASDIGSAIAREVGGGWPVTLPEIGEAVAAKQGRVSPFVSLPAPASVEELLVKPILRYAAAKGYDRVQIKPGAFKTGDLTALRRRYPLRPEVAAELEGIKAEQARRVAAGLPQNPRLEDPLRVLSERHERRAAMVRRQDRRLGHEAAAVAKRPPWPVEDADVPPPEIELLEPK